MKEEIDNRTPHILNTSANLLGFCFIVLTSVKLSKFEESTYIDEGAALAIIIFMCSCILSFLAMRSKSIFAKKNGEFCRFTISIWFNCSIYHHLTHRF